MGSIVNQSAGTVVASLRDANDCCAIHFPWVETHGYHRRSLRDPSMPPLLRRGHSTPTFFASTTLINSPVFPTTGIFLAFRALPGNSSRRKYVKQTW